MAQTETPPEIPDKLVVIWTSDDPYVAERVALMYTQFNETSLGTINIVWFTVSFYNKCHYRMAIHTRAANM